MRLASGKLGFALLVASLGVAAIRGALIFWRLSGGLGQRARAPRASGVSGQTRAFASRQFGASLDGNRSSGDPILVRRTGLSAPKDFPVSLPTRLDPKTPKVDSAAFYVASALLSGDSGSMVKFSEAGQEANVLAFQIAANAAALSGGPSLDSGATDDDGGAETPLQPEAAQPAPASSNSLEIRSADAPAIKTAIIRTSASDRISAVLSANGFSDESSGRIEAAFKTLFNFHRCPLAAAPSLSENVMQRALSRRATRHLSRRRLHWHGRSERERQLFRRGEAGGRRQFTRRQRDIGRAQCALYACRGLYSAGLRFAVPESIVREAIQLVGHGVDLKALLTADETFKALYARDTRGKAKESGKIIYVGVAARQAHITATSKNRKTLPLDVSIPKRPPIRLTSRPTRRHRQQSAGPRRPAQVRQRRQNRPKVARRVRT